MFPTFFCKEMLQTEQLKTKLKSLGKRRKSNASGLNDWSLSLHKHWKWIAQRHISSNLYYSITTGEEKISKQYYIKTDSFFNKILVVHTLISCNIIIESNRDLKTKVSMIANVIILIHSYRKHKRTKSSTKINTTILISIPC